MPKCPTLSHARRITITMLPELASFARRTCLRDGMTLSEYIRALIREHRAAGGYSAPTPTPTRRPRR